MTRWFKRLFFTVLVLVVGHVLVVQVLRWIAFGDEERAALALMEVAPAAPEGDSGFKYLAYPDLEVPDSELDAALAADLEAFAEWHAAAGERFAASGSVDVRPPPLPSASRYAPRAEVVPPDVECGFRNDDCLAKLRGHEEAVRTWLDAEAERLALAEKALAAGHFLNPYPNDVASPLANFRLLRLPINDIALQATQLWLRGGRPLRDGQSQFSTRVDASVRAGGEWWLRVEDLDPPREQPGAAEQVEHSDLAPTAVVLDEQANRVGALREGKVANGVGAGLQANPFRHHAVDLDDDQGRTV